MEYVPVRADHLPPRADRLPPRADHLLLLLTLFTLQLPCLSQTTHGPSVSTGYHEVTGDHEVTPVSGLIDPTQVTEESGVVRPRYVNRYRIRYLLDQSPETLTKSCKTYYGQTFANNFYSVINYFERICQIQSDQNLTVKMHPVNKIFLNNSSPVIINLDFELIIASIFDPFDHPSEDGIKREIKRCSDIVKKMENVSALEIRAKEKEKALHINEINATRDCPEVSMETKWMRLIFFGWKCEKGRYLDNITNTCKDVDECAADRDDCDEDTTRCVNTVGSYVCYCQGPQYSTDGRRCYGTPHQVELTTEVTERSPGVPGLTSDAHSTLGEELTSQLGDSLRVTEAMTSPSLTTWYSHITQPTSSVPEISTVPEITEDEPSTAESHTTHTAPVSTVSMWGIQLNCSNHLVVTEGEGEMVVQFLVYANMYTVCANLTDCTLTVHIDFKNFSTGVPRCRSSGVAIPQLVLGRPSGRVHMGTDELYSRPLSVTGRENKLKHWKISVPIKARIDSKYDGLQTYYMDLKLRRSSTSSEVIEHTVHRLTVDIIDRDRKATCQSINDPHVITFDGLEYNNYYEGEFILYKHKTKPFMVTTVYQSCGDHVTASCNCAVAVKSGDDVIVIERCYRHRRQAGTLFQTPGGQGTTMKIDMFLNGNLTQGTRVFQESDGIKYNIYLPHGLYVKVMVSNMLVNVWILASPADLNQTQGLCGTYDGNWQNDAHMRDGHVTQPQVNRTSRGQPSDFIQDWRVDTGDTGSLLRGVAASTSGVGTTSRKYCLSEPDRKQCGYGMDVETCDIFQALSHLHPLQVENCDSNSRLVVNEDDYGDEITQRLIDQARRHDATRSSRTKRDAGTFTINKANYDEEEPIIINKKFMPPKHKWKSQWNEVTAKDYCEGYLRKTPPGQLCSQIASVNMEAEIRTCIEDIQIIDDTLWASSARDSMKEQCLEEMRRNVSLSTNLTSTIQAAMCPLDCSQRGVCRQGVCDCNHGYAGVDCSVTVAMPPHMSRLGQYGLCDLRYGPCKVIMVFGSNFINGVNLTCHLHNCQVTNKTCIPLSRMTKVRAKFINFGAVECELPEVRSYLIYISNNGRDKSEQPLVFVPFNSQCQHCSTIGSFCYPKLNTSCVIDNKCYSPGEVSEHNECLICTYSKTLHGMQWNTSPNVRCRLAEWEIALAAAVGGSVIGVLLGFLLYKCCCKGGKRPLPGGARCSFDSRDAADQSPFEDSMLHRNRDLAAFASDRFTDLHHHQHPQFEESYFLNDGRGVENGVDSTTYF